MYRSIVLATLAAACCSIEVKAEEITRSQVKAILSAADSWKGTPYKFAGKDRSGIDCSHFVHVTYSQVLPNYKYRMAEDYLKDREFSRTNTPQRGDLIVFTAVDGLSAHVGIVTDPDRHQFIGSQSSTGVKETSYGAKTYWGKRPYRFLTLQGGANSIADRRHSTETKNKSLPSLTANRDRQGVQPEHRSNIARKKPRFTLHPIQVADTQIDAIRIHASVEPEQGHDRRVKTPKPVVNHPPDRYNLSQPVAYRVNIKSARIRLPELIEAADKGTDVIIRDDNGNSFRLIPIR
jgi:NlpC/P60 family